MRSLTGVGGLEKNHEERSGIIYALHDATGGGDTKNLVIRTHTRTGSKDQAALKSKGSKIAPLAINATQQTPNLEKEKET